MARRSATATMSRTPCRRRGLDGVAGEGRLVVPLTQEVGVDDRREDRVAEEERSEEDAGHDRQFDEGDGFHGGVVVCCGWKRESLESWAGEV